MSRSPLALREATPDDVAFLAGLWSDLLRRTDGEDQAADMGAIVTAAADSVSQRLLVADYDGEPVGAVLLRKATLSPLNLEPTVEIIAPWVASGFRRKGIGSALIEAGVSWAEESGVGYLAAAAPQSERDSNRFLARLALGSQFVLRSATTHAVRVKLTAQLPADRRTSGRVPLGQVLAARRSMRRARPLG